MAITLGGDKISVDLDGQHATDFDSGRPDLPPRKQRHEPKREPKRPEAGYLGLQTHDPGDVVWFKEVSVRPLPAGGKYSADSLALFHFKVRESRCSESLPLLRYLLR